MPRYKITIEYLGINLGGWQKQENIATVQGLIEDSIYKFSQEKSNVYGAGRTDAGVHAWGQVAHFDLNKSFSINTIINAINHFLKPNRISIVDCEEVDNNFHARFSAIQRHYLYHIFNKPNKPAINHDRVWWIKYPLNLGIMQEAAKYLIGQHDFSAFRSSACQANNPIRTINDIQIKERNQEIKIYISAQSFLHHMVRNIVGTLVNLNNSQEIRDILLSKNRSIAGPTAPAHGLYFLRVDYHL